MILRLLCALGFHREVEMEKLWLNPFAASRPLPWVIFRALFCGRCGDQLEDNEGYHVIHSRWLKQ